MLEKDLSYRPFADLVPAEWVRIDVEANGVPQHVLRTGGDKPPLLLLHGFMESSGGWLRLARVLADRFDVVMPDARVHGRSAKGEGFSPEILTADVLGLMEALNLERPIVYGHSNGAVTAFRVAVRRPDRVRALIMEEPPAGGRPMPAVKESMLETMHNWFDEWMAWLNDLKTMSHEDRLRSTAARWPHGMPIPPDEPLWGEDDFVGRIDSLARFDLTIFEDNIDFWSLLNELDDAAKIVCPTMLLTGEPMLGSLVLEDVILTLMERIGEFHWQQVAGGGHILSRGRPLQETLAVLEDFFEVVGV